MSVTLTPYFTPKSITGCSLWFDATDSSTITLSSGSLTQWNDKSGNGRNLTAVFANATVSSAYQNGLNVFNFSGNALYRTAANTAVYPQDVYIIVALKSTTAHVDVLGVGATNSGNFNSLTFGEYTANRWHNGSDYFNRTPNCISPTNETSTSFLLIQWSIANGNYLIRRNGTQLVQTATYSWTLPAGSIFQIGYRHPDNNGVNFSGYIGEIVVFNSQIGTTDRQNVEAYLAQKWGLTSSLPSGHIGLLTKLFASSSQAIQVTPYTSVSYAFAPTQITGCRLWLDGADPAGTGTAPANGATVSTWVDKSGNGKNAAATGSPTYLTGGGINFNGSSYFLNQTFSQNLSQRSIFIVMQETVHNNYFGVFPIIPSPSSASGGDGGEVTGLSIETTNGITFYGASGGYSPFMGNSTLLVKSIYNDNMNGTAGSGFLNGSSATTNTASYTAGTCSGYGIGGRWLSGAMNASYRLNGVIFEILYFNLPLGTTDRQKVESYLAQKWGIRSSLAAAHPGLTINYFLHQFMTTRGAITALAPATKIPINLTGLIIYYSFDNAIYDLYNVASLNLTGSISYVTGRRGQAVSLTNTAGSPSSNYISVTYALPTTFTVSLWFQTPTPSQTSGVFYAAPNISNVNGAVHIYTYASSLYCAYNNIVNNGAGYAISANTWYHALLTYNSGSSILYVNGSQSGNTITGTNSKSGITIGGSIDGGGNYPFTGYVDDLRIYNRILTGTEITAIYNGLA